MRGVGEGLAAGAVVSTATATPAATVTVNVSDLVDEGRFGRFQLRAFAVLGACLVADGFDVQAMGYVAPALVREWNLPAAAMGPVFGAGLLGLLVGSLVFSVLADRIGRRPVLVGATAVFGTFTLLTAHAGSLEALLAIRLAAGLGLGAIMPNATALVGEYSPRRLRTAAMIVVTNGFMVGAVLGGLLAAWLVPAYGWRAVFWVGGVAPLLLLPPMLRWLPESLQLLAVRGAPPARIARWARLVAPAAPSGPGVTYVAREERRAGLALAALFRGGRAPATALLWAMSFLNVLNAYFLASWLPMAVRDAGHSTSAAVLAGTAVQLGGAIGSFALGAVVQRLGVLPMLAGCFAVAAASLAALGTPGLPLAALAGVAFVAGWGIFGGQPGINALAATSYPTDLRATGVGAALAAGRTGAVLGPMLAAELMLRAWSHGELFRGAALPALGAAAIALAMRRVVRGGERAR